jgi:hypothetical protein
MAGSRAIWMAENVGQPVGWPYLANQNAFIDESNIHTIILCIAFVARLCFQQDDIRRQFTPTNPDSFLQQCK